MKQNRDSAIRCLCSAGGNYTISEAGVFALSRGKLQQPTGEAVLLVSDLDDTMIGNDCSHC